MTFEIKKTDGKARNCILNLPNGFVETPVFMPVGTQGTVKAMFTEKLDEIGFKIILANTYHMFLRPGCEVLDNFGGLNNFMQWDKPLLTDSGGFQIMSLSKLTKIENDGVYFKSHIDGKRFFLTPKLSMDIQNSIGSDIQMVLDQCVEYNTDEEKRIAEKVLNEVNKKLDGKVVTKISKIKNYVVAESYHQDWYKKKSLK